MLFGVRLNEPFNSTQKAMLDSNCRVLPDLLPGEKVEFNDSEVGFLCGAGKFTGRLVVTNYRLLFVSYEENYLIDVPLGNIGRLEKMGHSTMSRSEDNYGFEITCKDFRVIRFCSRQENHSRRPLFECLQRYAFPSTHQLPFFAFESKEKFPVNGWSVYDPVAEFKRMGVPNAKWRITDINENYNLANTYPSVLCVPTEASNEDLFKVANFRSRHRIPVCCWLHPSNQASLTRSSQPSVGVTARRNHGDERYLEMIIGTNGASHKLYVMDARPAVNARANKAKGGGYESEAAYPNAELVFLDIANIHVMRERKLRDMCTYSGEYKNWLSRLDDTKWLEHVRLVLCGAARIVDRIENFSTSVLVHCSDGWDRTSQLTSLSMLMLDPYYRTVKGFEVLVEKEWCSFGHKFHHRIGHGEDKPGDAERSPIFLQFLDCVHQLIEQFPESFEFNSGLLVAIMDHVYSCRFGTFLFNNECERDKNKVFSKTNSVWSYLNSKIDEFKNPIYCESNRTYVLYPCRSNRRMRFWTEYYLRWDAATMSSKCRDKLYKHIIRARGRLSKKLKERKHAKDAPISASNPILSILNEQSRITTTI